MTTIQIKTIMFWLMLGPALALLFSIASWYVFEQLTPGRLRSIGVMLTLFPQGLLMSLLTPWGWLMYGGFLLMQSQKLKLGIYCTVAGALLLGGFWPIWATDMATA